MDSFLRDSSGLSYDRDFINQISEKRILDVAHRAGYYVDTWAVQCPDDPILVRRRIITECPNLTEIRDELVSITEELMKIPENRNVQDLEVNSSTGESFSNFLSPLRPGGNVWRLKKDVEDLMQHMNFYSEQYIQNLYSTVKLIDFLLVDSLGQNYNHKFMNEILEKRILEINNLEQAVLCPPKERFKRERTNSEDSTMAKITEDIVCINEELKKIHDNRNVQDLEITSSTGKFSNFLSPSRRIQSTEGKLVGFEKDLVKMLDSLTGYPPQLKVLSITGMGGIGKTTFARKLYDNPLILHHFYIRVWVTVSQQYQVREMLLCVLCCVSIVSDEIYGRSDEELREQVYRLLQGKRYLIVLDDMWDTNAWDELKRTFPDDKNGSRIMLTSRLRDVAVHASQDTPPHSLNCLSIDESWGLLSSKIFMDESVPLELVEIGKQIAYKCRGLPLTLVVVGGLLSKMNKKLDIWQEVAQSVGSLAMEEADDCEDILALSYNHLSDHLKVCFLYIGNFPEDYEISVKTLIWLWIAEGFIRPNTSKSLEEVAEDYLEDLILRNLILVKRRSSDGRIKTCYIHDLMRELCLRESQKQNFLLIINNRGQLPLKTLHDDFLLRHGITHVPPSLHNLRRLSFHSSILEYIHKTSFPCTRSVMCFQKLPSSGPQNYLGMNLKLLKVLNIMSVRLRYIPREISNLPLLKFVALSLEDSLSIMYFFEYLNLQTLILDCESDVHLPRIFWDMLQLRHFHLKRSCLSYSQSELDPFDAELPLRVMDNLRSLSTVRPVNCTKKIFLSMPHLKKLGIHETEDDYIFRGWFKNLVHLQELERLKYVFSNPFVSSAFKPDRLPSWDSFPQKLVKLTLSGTSLPWDDMFKLSMLPKLEVLKLRNYAFSGTVWKSGEGGFRCLRFLLIGSTNLEVWESDGAHFPNLQHLVLRHCSFLKEIPHGIGEAPLLEKIELQCCKDSAVMSARLVQEEQQSFENDGLTIYITEGTASRKSILVNS